MEKKIPTELTKDQQVSLLEILKARFSKNMVRHKSVKWENVEKWLKASPSKLVALNAMELTGGEPDVVDLEENSQTEAKAFFVDCAPETPKERRSICYDHVALESRKEHKPANSAINMAQELGIEILNEKQYRKLQEFGAFDLKTSSWIVTPPEIRKLGGALFCDRRYNQVFTYHNGAESYYGVRGFRGYLKL